MNKEDTVNNAFSFPQTFRQGLSPKVSCDMREGYLIKSEGQNKDCFYNKEA